MTLLISVFSVTGYYYPDVAAAQTGSSSTFYVDITPGAVNKTTDAYLPNPVKVSVGDTVVWTNRDSTLHTATSGNPLDGTSGEFGGTSASPIFIAPGRTYEYAFEVEGEYDYYCTLHPAMVGQVIVTAHDKEEEEKVTLTVKSVDRAGEELNGMWSIIRDSEGNIIETGFTPLIFRGINGEDYKLHATLSNYDGMEFYRWQDEDGSYESTRVINLASDISLTAVYDTGDSQRGYTPLTYHDDDSDSNNEKPKLTVKAVSAKGSSLHMWTLIDPQADSSGESGTTYKVYIHNYNDMVFDHWQDGNKDKIRTLTITEDKTITAHYNNNLDKDTSGDLGEVASEEEDGVSNNRMYFTRTTYEVRPFTEIYSANVDGSDESQLTDNGYLERGASFSPDGKLIVFSSPEEYHDQSGTHSLYIMDSDGTDVRRLTAGALVHDKNPSWSPDGTKIAFSRTIFDQYPASTNIYILDINNGNTAKLEGSGLSDVFPKWSPDGSKIIFTARETSWPGSHVYIMNPDGTNVTRVSGETTDEEYLHYVAEFSPDGEKIAYATPVGIRIANLDGTDSRILHGTENVSGLTWTPDSSSVMFTQFDQYGSDSVDIFVIGVGDDDGDDEDEELTPVIVSLRANEGVPMFKPKGSGVSINLDGLNDIVTKAEETAQALASADVKFIDPSPDELGLRKVVFVRDDVDPEIWTINTDGSGQRKLTDNIFSDYTPAWSPDGSKIAFASIRDTNYRGFQLYTMNSDGSDVRRLTFDESFSDFDPAWSPDGSKIAFSRSPEVKSDDPTRWLYVINADGTGLKKLTETGTSAHPTWSPDGSKIAFSAQTNNATNPRTEIFVMNADGSEIDQLTYPDPDIFDFHIMPSWSPDGSKIAYKSRQGIEVMDSDGSNQKVLAGSEYASHPSWSPDGTKIIFTDVSDTSNPSDEGIYIMNADGSELQTFINDGSINHREMDAEIGPIVK